MKFGVTLLPDGLDALARCARLAEDLGFDYVGVGDSQSLFREVYVSLSVVATCTQRAMLGPTITNPLTRHPAVTASAIASVNELSGGRAFLGIGSGDSAVLNLGMRPARVAELRNYIQSVRDMLAGGAAEYQGVRDMLAGGAAEYQGRRAHIRWADSPIPIAMAAEGPRTLAMAGEIADAAIVHSGLTPGILADTIARIRQGERSADREQGAVDVWAFAKCNIAESREQAIQDIKMALAASGHHVFAFTLEGKHVPQELREAIYALRREYQASEHEQTGQTRNATLTDELGLTDYFADRFAIAGTPEECRAKTRSIFDSGVDGLLITAIGPDPDTIIRRFGQEVIAPLRNE